MTTTNSKHKIYYALRPFNKSFNFTLYCVMLHVKGKTEHAELTAHKFDDVSAGDPDYTNKFFINRQIHKAE